MNKEVIKYKYGEIKLLTNDSESKKMILYFHGLDGSASFSKPLFKLLGDYKIVAPEARGHMNSNVKSSRFIYKHLYDYETIINHYLKQGYKIWILGESMGAAYAVDLAYKLGRDKIQGVFSQSIPNKLENIMVAPKIIQFKIQLMTFISYLTNINYKYTASVRYDLLSSSKLLHRLARIADKSKKRQVRETLATWAITKRSWKKLKKKEPKIPIYYFQPSDDIITNVEKAKKWFNNKSSNLKTFYLIKDAKHILMYEDGFNEVVRIINEVMKK